MANSAEHTPYNDRKALRTLETEVEQALRTGERRWILMSRLLARGVPRDMALRLVDEVEHRQRAQRDSQHSSIAVVGGAIGCFVFCWIAAFVLRGMGVPAKIAGVAGGAFGVFLSMVAKECNLPGLTKGAVIGYLAYYASLPLFWAL